MPSKLPRPKGKSAKEVLPQDKEAKAKAKAWRESNPAKAAKTAAKYPYAPKSSTGESMGERLKQAEAARAKAPKSKRHLQPRVRSVSEMRFLYSQGIPFHQPAHFGKQHTPGKK